MTNHSSLESVFDEIRTTELATTTQFVVDHSSKGFGSHGMVVVEVAFKLPLLIFGHFLPLLHGFKCSTKHILEVFIRTLYNIFKQVKEINTITFQKKSQSCMTQCVLKSRL